MSTLQRRRMMMAQGVTYDGTPLEITNVGDEPSVITLIPYGSFNAQIYYKKGNGKFYKKWNYDAITLQPNSTLSLFGDSDVFSSSSSNYANFNITGSSIKLSGRLASISHTSGVKYTYYKLFQNCTSIVEVSSDFLEGVYTPTTGVNSDSILSYLFSNTGITQVPEGLFDFRQQPVKGQIYACLSVYAYMFKDCKSLVSVPQNIFENETYICQKQYRGMFSGCSSLTQAPDIYAENAPWLCCSEMFIGCVSLENPPQIAFNGYGSTSAFSYMFSGCTSLKQSPIMNDLIRDGSDASQHTLMFKGCSSLNYVKVSFTQWEIYYSDGNRLYSHTSEWLSNVSPTGTFVCPKELGQTLEGYYQSDGTWVEPTVSRGVNTVPSGWTIDYPIIDARGGDTNATALMAVIFAQEWSENSLYMMKSEAEKVEDIGTVFRGNNDIRDFTALQYFKLSEIKAYAFYQCYKLAKVILPNTITSLGDYCLSYTSIDSLIIPDSVVTIGEYVTNGTRTTKSVFIGKSVNSLDYRAIIDLDTCESIEVHPDNQNFDSRENCNAIIQTEGNQLLCGCASTIIPNTVTSIGSWAFQSNNAIAELTIPTSVVAYYGNAFGGTTNLKKIYYEGSFVDWFNISFNDSRYSNPLVEKQRISLIIDGENVISETMIIPEGVTSVRAYVFPDIPDIKHIVIPSSVASWNAQSFYNNQLESIVVNSGNATYDSREGCNAIVETASNKLVYACKNTIIPNSVTEIGHSAFRYTSVSPTIEIPASVTTIGNYSFNNSGIKTIKINAETPPKLGGANVFVSATIIYVPDDSVDTYKAANLWSALADRIKPLSDYTE